jgi:hypothetical protein
MNDKYFLDKGFKKIGTDIYVYKNFLSESDVLNLIPVFEDVENKSMFEPSLFGTTFENIVSVPLQGMQSVLEKVSTLFNSDFLVNQNTSINVMRKGDEWPLHSDSHDFLEKRKKSLLLKEGDPYDLVQDPKYGTVVYFNSVKNGGELYYSKQNILYSPSPGDLVVHSSEDNCMHGVNKILSGIRYSYSNCLTKEIKVPKA